jgi:hypothetical protein
MVVFDDIHLYSKIEEELKYPLSRVLETFRKKKTLLEAKEI